MKNLKSSHLKHHSLPPTPKSEKNYSHNENFSFYRDSNQSLSPKSIESPQMSQIFYLSNNEKSGFLTETPYITAFDEKISYSNKKNSIIYENIEIQPNLSENHSELNKGFFDISEEENEDKFLIFKESFEEFLNKCEYFENENMKKKIDDYLKNITKTKNKNKENFAPEVEESLKSTDFSKKTKVALKAFQSTKGIILIFPSIFK